jgi:nicotinamide-nucleotide amidase
MQNALELAAQIGTELKAKRLLLTVAESCTGGGVAQAITEIAGSSDWFDCGFVTYSNSSKSELLNIPAALIARHGAVSEEIAAAMAEGAIANSEGNVSLSTTGIAGRPVPFPVNLSAQSASAGSSAASHIPSD